MSAPPAHADRPAPHSIGELFLTFSWLALQGFGGVLAVAQRELVDRRRWLSREAYLEAYSVAQILPGPNVCNLSLMVGERFFGWPGALAALAGMLVFPFVIVLLLAALFAHFAELAPVAGALRGMGAVAAGLMLAMSLKLAGALRGNPLGPFWCAGLGLASLLAVTVWRLPLIWVVLGLGACGWALARRSLRHRARSDD